jgi:hypothetical protein
MKLFYTLVLAIFLLPFSGFAQTNYQKGLIITNSGETVNGFINYKEWYSNPDNISFKKNLTDKPQTYRATDISYFKIADLEDYQSATVEISLGKTDIQALSSQADTSFKTDRVFLKVAQKGSHVSLLSYTDIIKTRFYVTDSLLNPIPQELKYQPYLDKESTGLKKKNIYYVQLIDLANKYRPDSAQKIIDQIVVLNYKEGVIIKIINQINNNTPVAKKGKRTLSFYAGIGINASQFKPSGQSAYGVVDIEKASYLPELTVGLQLPFNPNTGRLIFRTDLTLNMIKAHISNYDAENTSTTIYTYVFKQINASIRPQLIYNAFNGKSFKFYVGGGAAINIARYTGVSVTRQMISPYVPGFNTLEVEDKPSTSGIWFTPVAKAGFMIGKKLDINFGYCIPTDISSAADTLSVSVTSVEAGLNYHF